MKARAALWLPLTTSTVVLSPVLVVLGVLVSLTNSDFAEPYWLDLSSKSTIGILFMAPGFAALAAWDAVRWRQLRGASLRSWVSLALLHAGFVALASAVTFLLVLVFLWVSHPPAAGLPRLDVLATAVWACAAYAVVGFVMGRFLPRLAAAPAAFVVVWLWVAYTPAVEPFWLRNVTGNLGTSCCSTSQQLAGGALGAPLLMTGVLLVAGLVLLPAATATRSIAAVAVLAVGTGVAAQWAGDLDADPVEPRTGAQKCVDEAALTVCGWPEHRDKLAPAAEALAPVAQRLREAGLDVPERLTAGGSASGWSLNLGGDTAEQWVGALVSSPLTALPPACAGEPGWGWSEAERLALTQAWLEVTAGRSAEDAATLNGAPARDLDHVLSLPASRQLAWFDTSVTAMGECERVS